MRVLLTSSAVVALSLTLTHLEQTDKATAKRIGNAVQTVNQSRTKMLDLDALAENDKEVLASEIESGPASDNDDATIAGAACEIIGVLRNVPIEGDYVIAA